MHGFRGGDELALAQPLGDHPLQSRAEAEAAVALGEVHPGQALVELRSEEGDGIESFGASPLFEPPAVAAALEVELGFDVVGDGPGVLDGFAVHVEDGERAVRGVDEVDGAEPVVARADEFGVFVGAAAFERDAVRGEAEVVRLPERTTGALRAELPTCDVVVGDWSGDLPLGKEEAELGRNVLLVQQPGAGTNFIDAEAWRAVLDDWPPDRVVTLPVALSGFLFQAPQPDHLAAALCLTIVPPLFDLPKGCAFAPRCPRASPRCTVERPLFDVRSGAACQDRKSVV